jgi:hypothetical protein
MGEKKASYTRTHTDIQDCDLLASRRERLPKPHTNPLGQLEHTRDWLLVTEMASSVNKARNTAERDTAIIKQNCLFKSWISHEPNFFSTTSSFVLFFATMNNSFCKMAGTTSVRVFTPLTSTMTPPTSQPQRVHQEKQGLATRCRDDGTVGNNAPGPFTEGNVRRNSWIADRSVHNLREMVGTVTRRCMDNVMPASKARKATCWSTNS